MYRDNMSKLKGKVVLVTGAARGIGKAIALESARQEAKVVIADILEKEMLQTLKELKKINPQSKAIKVDVRSSKEIANLTKQVLHTFSRIDIFFNNAGIIEVHEFLDITEEEWDKVMDINAKGVFLCAQNVAKIMKKQKSGVIINTSSVACRKGMPQTAVYAASKSVVTSLTWSMAIALAQYGVRVNAIAPGMIETDLWKYIDKKFAQVAKVPLGEVRKKRIQTIPMNRPGTAEEVAQVAIFLASDEARYVHGQVLNVNGGDFMS